MAKDNKARVKTQAGLTWFTNNSGRESPVFKNLRIEVQLKGRIIKTDY